MSGNSRSTTGSVRSNPSVSRSTTSLATLRRTRTSSMAKVATHWRPLRRNIVKPPALVPVDRGPEAVTVQLSGIQLHLLPRPRGHHGLALVVHVQHQLLGLVAAVAEKLLEH